MNIAHKTRFVLYSDGILPKRATKYSAGYDFAIPYDIEIEPKNRICVNTGVSVENEEPGINTVVLPRSGLFRKTGLLMNPDPSTTEAESPTRGIVTELYNAGNTKVKIDRGTNIGQIIFTAPYDPQTDAVPYTVDEGKLTPDAVADNHGIFTIGVPGETILAPGEAKVIVTHKAFAFIPTKVLMLVPSPALVSTRARLVNNIGVIDADYFGNPTNRGVIMLQIINTGEHEINLDSMFPLVNAYTANYYILALEDTPDEIRTGGLGSTDE